MLFSIRTRLFIIVLALAIPLCMFAWLLMQEVDKQVLFAQQEAQGVRIQAPLLQLLSNAHARKLALATGQDAAGFTQSITTAKTALDTIYNEVGSNIGFNEVKWTDLKGTVDKALAGSADDDAITAIKAMVARSSDGSNLTLDPDLDSYYAMDVGSFAIPAAIDNLGNAQSSIIQLNKREAGVLAAAEYAQIETLLYMIKSDQSRILGNLGITLAEDANFYGTSESLSRIKPLMGAYESQTNALLDFLKKNQTSESPASIEEITGAFEGARKPLFDLRDAVPAELAVLLAKRIDAMGTHKQKLLMEGSVAVAIGLALFALISQSIIGPINRLRRVMGELAHGNIDLEIPYLKKRDEIGQMANAVVVFKQNAETIRSIGKEFEHSVQQVVEIVASAATEMTATSQEMCSRAADSYKRLESLNSDITGASSNMNTVSASGEQLHAAINEISSQVQKSTSVTRGAVEEAANVRMVAEDLANSAKKVEGIVGLINSIASQINLLALNATIEAARAGESGKGFAVVASEVKTLANQTTNATAEIGQLVTAIQDSTGKTLEAVGQITSVIEEINGISSGIATAVEEQGMATKDISGHIKKASERMDNVNHNARLITESAQSSAAAANQTMQASAELSKQSETLRSDVATFLRKLLAS